MTISMFRSILPSSKISCSLCSCGFVMVTTMTSSFIYVFNMNKQWQHEPKIVQLQAHCTFTSACDGYTWGMA